MAKKTKTADGQTVTAPAPAAPPAGAGDAMAAARAARNQAQEKDRFHFVRDLEKGAPQAKGIVNILKAAGDKGLTRAELTQKMVGVVQTRQPQGRILSYYQKDLVNAGAIKIEKAAPSATPAVVAAPEPAAAS